MEDFFSSPIDIRGRVSIHSINVMNTAYTLFTELL